MVICGPTRQRTQMKLHRIVQPRRRPSVFRSQVLHDPMQPIGPGSAEFTYIDAFRAVSEVAREHQCRSAVHGEDRKSVWSGKGVYVRVDPGGPRIIKKKKQKQ